MSVEPHQRKPAVPGRKALDCADVSAAAAAEDERALGQLGGQHEVLLAERLLLDHGRLRVRQRQTGGLGHRLAALAPRPRHAHEPGGELAPAGMALVSGPERNRGERAAVGTARAEA